MPRPTAKKINVRALVARFGGIDSLPIRLQKAGLQTITASGICKWFQRGSIPADRLLDLDELARIEGKPIRLSSYLISADQEKAA